MPTLASVHSSQATISVEVHALQQGHHSMTLDRHGAADLTLQHSHLHVLFCPWEKPLHEALRALAGSKQASKAFGEQQYLIIGATAQPQDLAVVRRCMCIHCLCCLLHPSAWNGGRRVTTAYYSTLQFLAMLSFMISCMRWCVLSPWQRISQHQQTHCYMPSL